MSRWLRVGISCVMLVMAFAFLRSRSHGEAVPIRQSLRFFPTILGNWQSQEEAIMEDSVLKILKLDDYVTRRYADPSGHSLWLYIGYWETQRKGAQIHSPKHCLPGGGWEPLEAKTVTISIPGRTAPLEVNYYVIQKDQYRQLVFYWYHSQGRTTASEVEAKLQMVKNAMFHNRTDGALVRLISPINDSVQETFVRQEAYVQVLVPVLQQFLPE